LKILHVSPYYLPNVHFGGPVFSVSALCEALAAEGRIVTVYTVGYIEDGTVQYPFEEVINGVRVVYFQRNWGSPCQVSFQLWNALKNHSKEFDLIHLNTWWNILVFKSIQVIRKQQVPIVISLRGMLGDYSFSHRKTALKRFFQWAIGNKLLEYTQLLATSEQEAQEVCKRTGRNINTIKVLPNLLGLQRSNNYTAPPTGYKLGFLSRLHHKKGIEVLLNAVALCPEVDELIVGGGGDPAYEQQLKQQVDNLGLSQKVRFVGWVNQNGKADFFKLFHVFILPSFHENFANVVAEAWAAGKPVIVSKEVGLSDFVAQHGIGWVCSATTESTVQSIRQALAQKDQWRTMGQAALALVADQLTDEQIVSDYLTFYQATAHITETPLENKLKYTHSNLRAGNDRLKGDTYILGVNAFHADASAALLRNGKVVAAIEEERFRRVKHWAGFPSEAVKFCLQTAGIDASQLTHIAIGRDPKAKWAQKAKFTFRNPDAFAFAVRGRLNNANSAETVERKLSALLQGANNDQVNTKVEYVEHHRCHLASAFYASPFKEAALLSIDGSGDFSTTMMATGKGSDINVLQSIDFPNSLGIFYSAFTQLLGFPNYGDEYKVMGLAPFGQPIFADALKEVICLEPDGSFRLNSDWFRPPGKGYVMYNESHQPQVPALFSNLMEQRFGPVRGSNEPVTQRHKDLAASVQKMTEDTIFHLLRHLHKKTGLDNVCIAGGVAQNSVANGKITSNTPFKKVFIPPAGHDAGLSVGAAMYVHHHQLQQPKTSFSTAYTGAQYSNCDIQKVLEGQSISYKLLGDYDLLCGQVASCIADGGVIGWFRGRCEFGPRALGNRSILADPRRPDAKELLNKKIKRRESFRPFAPSILKEYVSEYFELIDDVPYMEKVFPIKKEKHQIIPAVTHVDGTGRLQTVSKETNADYYQLIETFRQQTGIPILLNTSFNENEPIVNTPTEALNCFLRTSMDMLVLEDYIITRDDKAI
jgi:carbamoyltransferase